MITLVCCLLSVMVVVLTASIALIVKIFIDHCRYLSQFAFSERVIQLKEADAKEQVLKQKIQDAELYREIQKKSIPDEAIVEFHRHAARGVDG